MRTFETLFTKFYDKVLKDDLLGEVFRNMSSEHIKHISHFVAEVFGGDKLYTTEDEGSHSIMIGRHIGKMLTEEKRQRWVHPFCFYGLFGMGNPYRCYQFSTDCKPNGTK